MMNKLFFVLIIFIGWFSSCKTSDSSTPESSPSATTETVIIPDAANSSGKLSKEDQHQFDALVKQGDSNYESGNYREALNFYKEARTLSPEQLGKSKLIACIKAMQEPSTRRKGK